MVNRLRAVGASLLLSVLTLVGVIAAAPPTQAVPTTPGAFRSLQPARLLDTRTGIGAAAVKIPARGTLRLQVTGRGGVGATGTVSAAVLNVTVVAPSASGYITAYPDGAGRPNASNVNFGSNQTIANLGAVRVGTNGRVAFYNGSEGSIHLLVDVSGYYLSGTPSAAGAFRSLQPARLLDTRTGIGAAAVKIPARGTLRLQVTGRGGVGATGTVSAAALNVTVASPTMSGYITAYPDGAARPNASNVNFGAGQTIANLGAVRVGTNGRVAFYNGSEGSIHLLVDVSGSYNAGTATAEGTFRSLQPARLLDTRGGVGGTTVPPRGTLQLQVTGLGGVGATGSVSAAALNVTVVSPSESGYITAYPAGAARPNASQVNFGPGQTIANLGMVRVGSNGKVSLYNGSEGTIELLADVSGYHVQPVTYRTFGAGTKRVGIDIAAGTYRLRTQPSYCYWERLSGFSGEFEDIIANNFTSVRDVVTIEPTDAGFSSDDCGTWTSDLSRVTASPTSGFGAGMMIVNTDVAPGLWRAPGGSECYWERVSGFTHEFDELLANDYGPTGPTVSIDASDAGFFSEDCGTWTKIG
ncbi:hypothetical protein [Knoellia subterranea]|uniref:Uncharacterized protein n=1 Tax=Knoellia subterranea KCTC 19937 TaxID=1385521 RepID=A0A0A0JKM6_9MICO|nr:hypothetical protein [Knoellia subterranea]KGN37643.1 hypothetical protein N803_11340 [Knoellia subterranea KCTC 19937]